MECCFFKNLEMLFKKPITIYIKLGKNKLGIFFNEDKTHEK